MQRKHEAGGPDVLIDADRAPIQDSAENASSTMTYSSRQFLLHPTSGTGAA